MCSQSVASKTDIGFDRILLLKKKVGARGLLGSISAQSVQRHCFQAPNTSPQKHTPNFKEHCCCKKQSVQGASWEAPRPNRSGSLAFEPRPGTPKIRHRNWQLPSAEKWGRCRKPLRERFCPTGSKARISCPRPTTSRADIGFEQDHPVEKGGRCEEHLGKDPGPITLKDSFVSNQNTSTETHSRLKRPNLLKAKACARRPLGRQLGPIGPKAQIMCSQSVASKADIGFDRILLLKKKVGARGLLGSISAQSVQRHCFQAPNTSPQKHTPNFKEHCCCKKQSVQGASWEAPRPNRSGSLAFEPRPGTPKIRHRNWQLPSAEKWGRCRKPLRERFCPTGSKARISCPRPTTSKADFGFEQDHPVEKGGRCEELLGKDPGPTG